MGVFGTGMVLAPGLGPALGGIAIDAPQLARNVLSAAAVSGDCHCRRSDLYAHRRRVPCACRDSIGRAMACYAWRCIAV